MKYFFHQKLNPDNLIGNNKNEKFYKVRNANIVEKCKNISTHRIVNILFYMLPEKHRCKITYQLHFYLMKTEQVRNNGYRISR